MNEYEERYWTEEEAEMIRDESWRAIGAKEVEMMLAEAEKIEEMELEDWKVECEIDAMIQAGTWEAWTAVEAMEV